MNKVLGVVAAVVAAVTIGGTAPADAQHRHIPGKVCRSAWQHPSSTVVNQCQRQGWTIEVDYDGLDNLWQVLVIGPKGHVWVDNLGAIETR